MEPYDPPTVDGPFVPAATDRLELGEGIRFLDDGRIVLVDILTGRLLALSTGSEASRMSVLATLSDPLGAVAPIADGQGFLAATGTGFAFLTRNGAVTRSISVPGLDVPPAQRMNDAVCDPQGRMWAGSMAYDASPGAGALHRLDPDGTVHTVLEGLTVPNGPVFSPDGEVMYLADSALGVVYSHKADVRTGELSPARPFFRVAPGTGGPDGMTVDAQGRLWSAIWGAGEIRCFSPEGALLARIDLPAVQPSSLCLTGSHILVTTARYGLEAPGPLDGAVLAAPCRVPAPRARSAV